MPIRGHTFDKLRRIGITPVGFDYDVPQPSRGRVANPMFTHYSWLWRWIDPVQIPHLDADDEATFWARIPQPPPGGWPGPQIGYLEGGAPLFAEYGALHLYDHLVARFRGIVVRFPYMIRKHAGDLADLYLDSLAEHLRYIDPRQLPQETLDFIQSREAST